MSLSPSLRTIITEFTLRAGHLPDRGIMPVPFPVADHYVTYDKNDPRLLTAPIRRVPLSQLRATQRTIDSQNVQQFLQDPETGGPPVVLNRDNGYDIIDGHHRLSAAVMRGDTHMDVHVVEDAPAMAAGNGGVAGLGVGPHGEPGVDLRKKRWSEVYEGSFVVRRLAASKEHRIDFWQIGNDVYRAPRESGKDTAGLPLGKRWECSVDHWHRYRQVFSWATDVKTRLAEDAHDRFANADVFDVDTDKFLSVRDVKKPWERFSKYVGIEEEGEAIRAHARKNWKKSIILRDQRTGAMRFLRKRGMHG